MLKVVGLPVLSNLVYQSAYLTGELEGIVAALQRRVGMARLGSDVVANEAVRQRHQRNGADCVDASGHGHATSSTRQNVEGNDCSICFDSLGSNLSRLTFCQQTCGANFHSACIEMWTSQPGQRNNPTCPNCRQSWVDVSKMAACANRKRKAEGRSGVNDEGYENLGVLQGQSPVRDTSTYNSNGWNRGYRHGGYESDDDSRGERWRY